MALAVLELTKINAMSWKFIERLFGKHGKEKIEPISFRQGFDLTELPIVTLYQGNVKLNFVLDTGSSISVIDKKVLKDIKYKETDQSIPLVGIEGNLNSRDICQIELEYKGKKYECDCSVIDLTKAFATLKESHGVTLHGLLGSQFFNKYKYVLDFEELIAYSKI